MSIVFFDPPENRESLLPLTYTRPISEIRIGIFKISEKWNTYLETDHFGYETEGYLSDCFPSTTKDAQTTWINATILPNPELVESIQALGAHQALVVNDLMIGYKGDSLNPKAIVNKKSYTGTFTQIKHPWDIFRFNGQEIINDFQYIRSSKGSQHIVDPYTSIYGNDIFLEEGVSIKAAILNAENGPIYIGKNASIHEGSIIRGPFAMCEGSELRMGAKIRGDTTVGPYSKVGGEVSNSVFFGNSNKAHDGYLGNSVIGEWCNLGAGTNNSNLKNTYEPVKMWNYSSHQFEQTDLQFCGLIMGDHTKAGINTMFNTGTTVGVAANIFGGGFPRQIIPSFSWGGARGFVTYDFQKAIRTITTVMDRRGIKLTENEESMLRKVFESTAEVRSWEKQNK